MSGYFIRKTKAKNLEMNAIIQREGKIYFVVGVSYDKKLIMFQSTDGEDRFSLDFETTVDQLFTKIRGFELVSKKAVEKLYEEKVGDDSTIVMIAPGIIPVCKTEKSAAYDLCIPEVCKVVIKAGETVKVYSNVKAYMQDDEFLFIDIRSSIGIKKHLMIANTIGVIDSDYYNNQDNEGNICLSLYNYGTTDVTLMPGDAVCQGIFMKKLLADTGNSTNKRTGGIGSTSKEVK